MLSSPLRSADLAGPPLRWADLAGTRVGIWGLGEEGAASRRRVEAMGVVPALVDDSPRQPGVVATTAGGWEALAACDVVIKSPGISRYREDVVALGDSGTAVVGGLGLWLEGVDRDRVICVTGTKGKSTTVSILGHLIAGTGRTCVVGGNIGRVPWDTGAGADPELWIIEVSSFQATDLWSAPPTVAVTALHPDHLDWHGTAERYFADKLSLCTKPGARHVIANGTDLLLRDHAELLGPSPQWVIPTHSPDEAWVDGLALRGEHNRTNALIAAACLSAVGIDASSDRLRVMASGFEGLPSRLHTVAEIDGVEFVDDSLSTNVLPTVAAVSVFADRRVALLVGGYDRDIDYAPLAAHLGDRRVPLLVIAMPDNGRRILDTIAQHGHQDCVELEAVDDLDAAVARGSEWARPDGVVLLSPAAPSFGHFADYRARADAFRRAIPGCGGV
jgi:UDP-N-acetylmuramoylalanine--D-glutamate ligase